MSNDYFRLAEYDRALKKKRIVDYRKFLSAERSNSAFAARYTSKTLWKNHTAKLKLISESDASYHTDSDVGSHLPLKGKCGGASKLRKNKNLMKKQKQSKKSYHHSSTRSMWTSAQV